MRNWDRFRMINETLLTFDCDWAPDFVINDIINLLDAEKIKATFFITNNSQILKKLRGNKLFEIGIHPNFFPKSTQGSNEDSILNNLKQIVPEAKSIRTHGLFQSTPLVKKFQEYGIENDLSLFLQNTPNIVPHYSKFFNLFRFPYFWEDDVAITEKVNWSFEDPLYHVNGLKIFNFHPIHVFLNSNNMDNYENLKKEIGLEQLNEENIKNYVNQSDIGVKSFFIEIISSLKNKETFTIQNLREN